VKLSAVLLIPHSSALLLFRVFFWAVTWALEGWVPVASAAIQIVISRGSPIYTATHFTIAMVSFFT
jgi:hypothetical protein